jgi:hypothetical protein
MKSSLRSVIRRPTRAALLAVGTLGLALVAVPGTGPVSLGGVRPAAATGTDAGYWLVAADGAVFPFGSARSFGPNRNQGPDIVGMGRTPDGRGYWMVDEDGDVFHYGSAPNLGSRVYNADDVVGFTARPRGAGYWLVASDGGVFSFGEAAFHGSTGAIRLNQPIVGMAATPTGDGYWLVASDGGIFTFGDAAFHGSTGAMRLNQPIVGMAATPTGDGYWLVASDGGIFSFGDGAFHGSTGAIRLNQPIVGMAATPTGDGYWLVASDGGIFSFGDGAFHGSTGGQVLGQPIIGVVAALPDQRPAAAPDSATVEEDVSATVAVLGNDTGIGDPGITVTVVDPPGHGVAVAGADGRITYTPAADYAGPDSLVYRVSDVDGDQATASVSITVTPRNDAPVAPDWSITTPEDTAVPGAIGATDADGDLLTFALSSPPGHGTASVDGSSGAFTYTPDTGYSGPDSFVVTVDDGHGATVTSVVAVAVDGMDERPAAAADAAGTDEETAVVVDVVANDTGLGDGGVVVSVDVATLDPTTEGTATVVGGAITFVPALDVTGTVAFDYTIADADGDSGRATVTVAVAPVNDAPTISGIGNLTVSFGTRDSGPLPFTVADVDNPAGSLTVTATSSNHELVPDGNLDLTHVGSGGNWTLVVTPVRHVAGVTTITLTVSDGTTSTQTTFVFDVTPR